MLWSACFGGGVFTVGTAPITWTALPATVAGSDGVLFMEDGLAGNVGTYCGQCNSGGESTPGIITVALLGPGPVAVTPTFSPVAGSYNSAQTVMISTTTPESTIYYTTDGTTPTYPISGTTQQYFSPISITTSETVNAITVSTGYSNSAAGIAAYVIGMPASAPTFSPGAGTYTTAQTVTISDSTTGAAIYYTTNGTTPTANSTLYTGSISVSTSETLEAIATANSYNPSSIGSAAYIINLPQAATPTFSPTAGTYTSPQTITISDTTAGAKIYYTTNGTTPTTTSTLYSGPVTVSSTQTLEAIATAAGYNSSVTGSAAYTISLSGITAPTFVQQCNSYYNNNTGTLACTLTGVGAGHALMIGFYNQTLPVTFVNSTHGTPVLVTSVGTMCAYLLSNTTAGSYTITANFSGAGYSKTGLSVVEYANVAASPLDTSATKTISAYTTNISIPNFTTTSANDMLWTNCEGADVPSVGTAPITWTALPSPSGSGIAELVEDGAAGDAGTYFGQCNAIDSSSGGIVTVALIGASIPAAATPTFSPASGSYNTAQTVTISDITPGAAIYYTTNGTIPTSSSTFYSTPIIVAGSTTSTTVNAIAVAGGYTTSAVGSATYTIPTPAALTTPAPGTQLSGTSVTFAWTPGNATLFQLFVGTTGVGSHDVYNSGPVKVDSEGVGGLPSNGEIVYVRFYWYINGTWSNVDYTYKAYGAQTPAALTMPAPSSQLSGTSVNFTWTPGNTATLFQLFVGTTGVGSHDVYNSGPVKVDSEGVSGLPSNGETVYVRLYWLIGSTWSTADYTYKASGSPAPAALTTPTPGTTLSGTSVSFSWNPGNTAKSFQLFVGTTGVGSHNVYNSGAVTATSETVSGLPTNVSKVYVRLYWLINGVWSAADYTYKAQ
jgi:hypothetical protein